VGESADVSLRIELLDRFRVVVDDRPVPVEAWRRSKAAALVKLLALAPRHRLQREQVMDQIWPALGPAAAAANLRKALHYARRAVDEGSALIVSTGDVLSLPVERVSVDVDGWQAEAAQARRIGDPSVYSETVELYGAGLLPEDRYEDWAAPRRAELQGEFVSLLEELAGLLESRGERSTGRLPRLSVWSSSNRCASRGICS
jgi:DNA-binding SARP family transcriptional activator